MTVIDATMEEVSYSLVDERRCPIHNIQAAAPFPISGVLPKIGIPVRVAWNQLLTSDMLGIVFLAHSREWVKSALCDPDSPNFAPQIQAPDSLDVNRHLYCKVVNISRPGMLLSTSLSNKHLLFRMVLEPAELFVLRAQFLSLHLTLQNMHEIYKLLQPSIH